VKLDLTENEKKAKELMKKALEECDEGEEIWDEIDMLLVADFERESEERRKREEDFKKFFEELKELGKAYSKGEKSEK